MRKRFCISGIEMTRRVFLPERLESENPGKRRQGELNQDLQPEGFNMNSRGRSAGEEKQLTINSARAYG
jgi:hypothetical protein